MSIYMVIFFIFFSFILGIFLSSLKYIFPLKKDPIIEEINDCFPQSQCGQCGYAGCYAYAEAICIKSEKINKCLPGGNIVISQICDILNIQYSEEIFFKKETSISDSIVFIDEKNCVGCGKCAAFCPMDAIVGAPNFMHTVLEKFCTGCDICIVHCPTNCIHKKKINYYHEKNNYV